MHTSGMSEVVFVIDAVERPATNSLTCQSFCPASCLHLVREPLQRVCASPCMSNFSQIVSNINEIVNKVIQNWEDSMLTIKAKL